MISHDSLITQINYIPETGEMFWRSKKRGVKNDMSAGCLCSDGYIRVKICGKLQLAHRLAWLYVTGEMPILFIDHINRVRHDNRIDNLRAVNAIENSQNVSISKKNTSGFTGVSFQKEKKKWRATIGTCGRWIFLGYFNTPEEANKAYVFAKSRMHTFNS
jgi:hypothetical protein